MASTFSTLPEPTRVLTAEDVAKMLRLSRATFYTLPFFRTRKVRTSPRRVGYLVSDVELYLSLQRGK